MGQKNDFSWKTDKHILNHNVGKIVPIMPEPFGAIISNSPYVDQKEEINQLINTFKARLSDKSAIVENTPHVDQKEEIDQLFNAFKRRLSDIISREAENK